MSKVIKVRRVLVSYTAGDKDHRFIKRMLKMVGVTLTNRPDVSVEDEVEVPQLPRLTGDVIQGG